MKTKIILFLSIVAFSNRMKAQWATESTGFATSGYGINSISIVNSNVVWATAYDTAGTAIVNKFTRTLNGGTTWTAGSITGANAWDLTSISAYNKDTAWVSMVDNANGGGKIYRTNNGGANWTAQTTATLAAPGGWADFVYFFNKNNGVCVGDSNSGYWEIYSTVNGGSNWSRVLSVNIPTNTIGETGNDNSYSVVGNTIWFGTSSGRVYKSINMGTTWTVANTGLTNCSRVAFKDASNGIATDGTLLVKTNNGGTSWTPLTFTGNFYGYDLTFIPGTTGTYINTGWGSGSNGSSYSINDGATWINIDAIGHHAVSFLNSTTGWSGGVNTSSTVGGMFKWTGTFTGVGIKNNDHLNGISLNVFPNPFSNQVTIVVSSEKTSLTNLSVEIIDVLGNTVTKRNDFSENKMVLNRDNFVSGIYFYKVYTSNLVIGTGRLIAQ